MPPQELPRHATLRELFADTNTPNSYRMALCMTIHMLRTYRYIRIDGLSGLHAYAHTISTIILIAFLEYDDHALEIRSDVSMSRESFIASFQNLFHRKYKQYAADGYLQFAIVRSCAFTMNMCRYIHVNGMSKRYMGVIVMLLSLFINGQRFRRDADFALFDERFSSNLISADLTMDMLLQAVIGDENREPLEIFLNIEHFRREINDANFPD